MIPPFYSSKWQDKTTGPVSPVRQEGPGNLIHFDCVCNSWRAITASAMESSSKGATDIDGTLGALFDLTLGSGGTRIRSSITVASKGADWTETQRRLEQCVDILQGVLAYSKTLQVHAER